MRIVDAACAVSERYDDWRKTLRKPNTTLKAFDTRCHFNVAKSI